VGISAADAANLIEETVQDLEDIIDDELEQQDGDDSDDEGVHVDEAGLILQAGVRFASMINPTAMNGLQVHQVEPSEMLHVLGTYMADLMSKNEIKLQPPSVLSEEEQKEFDLEKKAQAKQRRDEKKAAKQLAAAEGRSIPKDRTKTAPKEKKEKEKKEKADQFIATKKLKHYLDGLFIAVEKMRPELLAIQQSSKNPLVLYVLSVLLDQLSITMSPFHDYIKEGRMLTFYEKFPHMITYLAWYGHTTLIKAYMFNLLCINHWRDNRPDILRKLALMCKWLNDVYIEHHHSVMARILKRLFPNNFSFPCIRWSSIFASAARVFWNIVSKRSFTQCAPATITAEPEDLYMGTEDGTYNAQLGLLRKKDKTKAIIIPDLHGISAASSNERIAIKEKVSEPLQQICLWEHDSIQVDHVCDFVRALVGNLDAMDISVVDFPTPEQVVDTKSMNSYRPLTLCKNHVPYCLALFTSYLMNAKVADDKLIALKKRLSCMYFWRSIQ